MNKRFFPTISTIFLFALLIVVLPASAQDGEPLHCPGSPESRLVIGAGGRVTPESANRMRDQPSTGGAEVGQIPGGERFEVLDGPVCADNLAWWQVDYGGLVGWTVEGSGDDYWVEPATPLVPADIVFASEGNGESQIFTVDTGGDHLTSLGEPGVYQRIPSISPDGTQIAYAGIDPAGDGFVAVMNLDGGNPIILAGGTGYDNADHIAWSPDGTQIVFVVDTDGPGEEDGNNIYIVDADSGNLRVLTSGLDDHAGPTWSPDGTQIAFAANYDDTSLNLHVVDLASGEIRQITANDYTPGSPSWSPDGSAIGFTAFVPDAEITGQMFVVNPEGSDERQPTGAGQHTASFAWSPDGSRILFLALRGDDPAMEVYVVNADGSDLRQLTDNDVRESCPSWSPDGAQIVFVSELGVDPGSSFRGDVYVMDANGENMLRLTDNGRRDVCPQWIP